MRYSKIILLACFVLVLILTTYIIYNQFSILKNSNSSNVLDENKVVKKLLDHLYENYRVHDRNVDTITLEYLDIFNYDGKTYTFFITNELVSNNDKNTLFGFYEIIQKGSEVLFNDFAINNYNSNNNNPLNVISVGSGDNFFGLILNKEVSEIEFYAKGKYIDRIYVRKPYYFINIPNSDNINIEIQLLNLGNGVIERLII